MAVLDSQLVLDVNSSLAVAAPGIPSAETIDWLGAGVGQPPPNYFGVQSSVFGEDIGPGDGMSPPKVLCIVGTSFATATAGTLRVQLQESVDSGAPSYTPAAWQTIAQTEDYPVAVLTAGTQLASIAIPPRNPGQGMPRFFRLNYLLNVAGSSFTAGTLSSYVTTGVDAVTNTIYPAAY